MENTAFRDRFAASDAHVRGHLHADEQVLAIGRADDVTEGVGASGGVGLDVRDGNGPGAQMDPPSQPQTGSVTRARQRHRRVRGVPRPPVRHRPSTPAAHASPSRSGSSVPLVRVGQRLRERLLHPNVDRLQPPGHRGRIGAEGVLEGSWSPCGRPHLIASHGGTVPAFERSVVPGRAVRANAEGDGWH